MNQMSLETWSVFFLGVLGFIGKYGRWYSNLAISDVVIEVFNDWDFYKDFILWLRSVSRGVFLEMLCSLFADLVVYVKIFPTTYKITILVALFWHYYRRVQVMQLDNSWVDIDVEISFQNYVCRRIYSAISLPTENIFWEDHITYEVAEYILWFMQHARKSQ